MRNLLALVGLFSVLILAGCAQQGSYQGSPQGPGASAQPMVGTAVFTIADKAADMGSVSAINITVDSVQVHSQAGGWTTVSSAPQTFDLLQLKASGAQALLAEANLSNGTYEQLRLEVSKVVVTDASGVHEAKLPSGDLRLAGGFDVGGNSTSVATFDFEADKSLHVTGDGKYILAPVIHLQTRDMAQVNASDARDVRIQGGNVRTDAELGMDENGTIGNGAMISPGADLSIDGSGRVTVGLPPMANASQKGRVVVGIKDKAADMGSVTSVNVTISGVEVHGASGGWVNLSSEPMTFDLLRLKASGAEDVLADANISSGTYQQIRLDISQVIVTDGNGTHQAKLPSGELRLDGPLVVGGNSTSTATIDFLANESLHVTGDGLYIMAPVVMLETRGNATVSVNPRGEVEAKTGGIVARAKEGMDENGTSGAGIGIPADADVSVDPSGRISVGNPAHPGLPLNVTANASIVGRMD
jgi:hypothetical protein